VVFQHFFEDPDQLDDPQLLKSCKQLQKCSIIIPKLVPSQKKYEFLVKIA
jgi:hypothetical protein